MNFSSVWDEKQSFAAPQHLHYRSDVLSKEAFIKGKIQTMEPNYLDIEALVQRARQQRNHALGELLSAAWSQCKALFSGYGRDAHHKTVLWRVLPP